MYVDIHGYDTRSGENMDLHMPRVIKDIYQVLVFSTQMSMFSIHILFLYLLLQKNGSYLSILRTGVYDIL